MIEYTESYKSFVAVCSIVNRPGDACATIFTVCFTTTETELLVSRGDSSEAGAQNAHDVDRLDTGHTRVCFSDHLSPMIISYQRPSQRSALLSRPETAGQHPVLLPAYAATILSASRLGDLDMAVTKSR